MPLHIKEFMENDYTQYAVYRVYQRIPHVLDTLGQTQRKILYTLEQFPETKKFKTAEVYSKVYDITSYLHGDASVHTVTENLAIECSNNLNLLTPEGSFGYRTNKSAAAPRYTSTRFSKIARAIFRKEDKPILIPQEFEGKTIENKFLLPIIPVSLLNGYNAIAVGYASKFLPRHPQELINAIIDALRYHKRKNANWENYKIPDLVPAFPFYHGHVTLDQSASSKSTWILTGAIVKKPKNIIEIVDLPPEASRESYIKKLKRLVEKGTIKSWTEKCTKNKFHFTIKVTPDFYKQTDDELMKQLNIVDRTSENFTFLNPDGNSKNTVLKFDTVGEYLKEFVGLRLKWYLIRKQYQLDKLRDEILLLREKIKFINDVNNEEIVIVRRKKSDLEKELHEKGFHKILDSFDHLLGMKMYALTEENVRKFMEWIKEKETGVKKLEETRPEDLYIKDLQDLSKLIQPELKKKELV